MRRVIGGLFVGGHSSRMGRAKGLLQAPEGGTLIARTGGLLDALHVPWVLIGKRADYVHLPYDSLDDEPPGMGPLGGLIALLRHAGEGTAVAVACDMPFITRSFLARLLLADAGPAILAPRRGDRWEPLFARFEASQVLPAALARRDAGQLSLQGLFDELGATALHMSADEERHLDDWDAPEDIAEVRRP